MSGGPEPKLVGGGDEAPPKAGQETLSLVIPAYNEESRLPALLETLATTADAAVEAGGFRLLETLIVDDGSSDRTWEMLGEAGLSDPRLYPVSVGDRNQGKGAAVAAGVRHASGDYVLLADVDLSTPLEELQKLGDAVRAGADLAIGSRAAAGAVVERGPAHRKLMGKAFNGTVRGLTGLDLKDTQCGFKLIPTPMAKQLLSGQECPGFAFDVEMLMRARLASLRVAEVPVVYVHDHHSRVKVVGASLEMLRDVTRLAYRLRLRGSSRGLRPGMQRGPLAEFSADDRD